MALLDMPGSLNIIEDTVEIEVDDEVGAAFINDELDAVDEFELLLPPWWWRCVPDVA